MNLLKIERENKMDQKVTHTVTRIKGDGVGPEVVDAACKIIEAAGVSIA